MDAAAGRSWVQRYECKYLVSESVACSVRECALPFVKPDANAASRPGHAYPIVSLYLDTNGLALNRETLEGQRDRFKLRIRAYDDEPGSHAFLEVKRRRNQIVHKDRCKISRAEMARILTQRGGGARPLILNAKEASAHAEFERLMLLVDARPVVLVRYERQAYVGAFDPEVRVTFDRRLAAARTERCELRLKGPDFSAVEERLVIVELKFNQRCPAWLDAIVHSHGLRQRSFSKYADCLANPMQRRLAPDRTL